MFQVVVVAKAAAAVAAANVSKAFSFKSYIMRQSVEIQLFQDLTRRSLKLDTGS